MLADPQCVDYRDILQKYKSRIGAHAKQLEDYTQQRIEIVKDKLSGIDMQRAFAYLGAFNATCSGGHNRKTSFINLDLINNLLKPQAKPTKIEKDGQTTESSDVVASGIDHLTGFNVSMKNAKGPKFTFAWDPHAIPDKVTVKDSSGEILFDSGCKGSPEQTVELPVPKTGKIEIDVVNDCENPVSLGSALNLRIKCQEEPVLQCAEFREELSKLLQQEVELTKQLIDANSLHRECLFYMDKDLLTDLLGDGLIELEDKPMTNGICETGDETCEGEILEQKHRDQRATKPPIISRGPSADPFKCPVNSQDDSIFQKLSNAYCRVGWKRLEQEKQPDQEDLFAQSCQNRQRLT
jgi:hypothetical protein